MKGEKTIDDIFKEIGELLLKHRLALFFDETPGRIWQNGKEIGSIDHDPGGCGHTFIFKRNETFSLTNSRDW